MTDLANIRIVLINTSHPGNIGAAARAMKTMGLDSLVLVDPKIFPSAEATARASGADDVLAAARVCERLDDALAGCRWVVGTSARLRSIPVPVMDPRETAQQAVAEAGQGEVAIVFGREHSGLTNEELDRCHALVNIPSNPEYSSLNLGAAVQVLAYELRMAAGGAAAAAAESADLAGAQEVERFHEHLQQTLVELEFLDPENPKHLMRRLRRLFHRARLEQTEVNILRGILTAAQNARRSRGKG